MPDLRVVEKRMHEATKSRTGAERIRLVVNADDFGYAPGVSQGIVECANRGIVTATGVFGNTADPRECARMLRDAPRLEAGVHLTLSHGAPLTEAMRSRLARHGGRFPDKFAMAWAVSRGAIRRDVLETELRAQVDAIREAGIAIAFLNAHEHLHMHPRIFPIVRMLAREAGVRHVRITRRDLVGGGGLGGIVRGAVISMLAPRDVDGIDGGVGFLGLARSGRIDVSYLTEVIPLLRPGRTYELMCHPGFVDPVLARDARLAKYHDWDLERRALQDASVRALLVRHGVDLVRFSELGARSCSDDLPA
jgi:predicted glycoside hydrolase/deacetylase ChbG (UPF0249 family)